ncbi:hypothetical protein AB1Y20_009275 [Prymnesium parvum]|uniref:PH domain-containing protein n=1 Tax=Prymnesium parvum TaxID=97485 RepID=A0AB34K1Q0_PRYPA
MADLRDRSLSAPSGALRASSRRRSSIAEWADAVYVHVSRRGSSQASLDRATARWAAKARAAAPLAEWEEAQALHVQHVIEHLRACADEPARPIRHLTDLIEALAAQEKAEELYAARMSDCHALWQAARRSGAEGGELPPSVSESTAASESHASALAQGARDRAHRLSHSAGSLRRAREELEDERTAAARTLAARQPPLRRLLERVRAASAALHAGCERQRALVGYAATCAVEADLWLLAHRMAHAADAYVAETAELAALAAELRARLRAASERAARRVESALADGSAAPRVDRRGDELPHGWHGWRKADADARELALAAAPMPSPSSLAIKCGRLDRFAAGGLRGADAWLSEWAVLSVDGFLHLFTCAPSEVVGGEKPPELPSLSLECCVGPAPCATRLSESSTTRIRVLATVRSGPLWSRVQQLAGWQPQISTYEFDCGRMAGEMESWLDAFSEWQSNASHS